jgi:hypothetical protein
MRSLTVDWNDWNNTVFGVDYTVLGSILFYLTGK